MKLDDLEFRAKQRPSRTSSRITPRMRWDTSPTTIEDAAYGKQFDAASSGVPRARSRSCTTATAIRVRVAGVVRARLGPRLQVLCALHARFSQPLHLYSEGGSGNTWLRFLLEYTTSISMGGIFKVEGECHDGLLLCNTPRDDHLPRN